MKIAVLAIVGTLVLALQPFDTSAAEAPAAGTSAPRLRGGFSGEEMLGHCSAEEKDPVKDFGRGICIGFIAGFTAGHLVAGPTMPSITVMKRSTTSTAAFAFRTL